MGNCMVGASSQLDPKVQVILDEINEKTPSSVTCQQKELRTETKQFLNTAHMYLECRKAMDAKYAEIDPDSTVANLDIQTDSGGIVQKDSDNPMAYKQEYQQQAADGSPVKKLPELYDAAKTAQEVYQGIIQELVDKVMQECGDEVDGSSENKTTNDDTPGVKLQFAPLKGRERAQEKADDDYSNRIPGPGASWLYDIVRGSIKFSTAAQIAKCLELIQADPTIHIVKAKNRFQNPTLTGYRDFNLCIRIDTPQGFQHICEIQIHLAPIKKLSIELDSHKHYEYFRSYFDGSTDSLEDRLKDLQQIVQEHAETVVRTRSIDSNGVLDEGLLQRLLDKGQNEERIDRLGDLFREYLCEYDWSLRAYAKLLNIRLKKYGCDDASVASTLKEIALVLQHQRRLEDSMAFFEQCLDIQKRVLGETHLEVANTLCSMAQVLRFQGKIDEALDSLQRGLELKKQSLGEEHVSAANTFNTIGGVYFNKRELGKAMEYFQKSLDIYVNVIGEDHKFIANTYNNMALVLVDQGEYDKALQQYEECLDIQNRTLGEEHATISTTYSNIGDVHVHKKDPDKAMEYYQKSVEIKMKTLGADHPSVANIYRNMVKALKQKGDMTQAMDLEAKAYKIEKAAKKKANR